ncbi:DUF3108 domain-containing protein [Xanthobacter sp. V4C-4]|uniref:DUF3108 domain-containing protein n=1 Tax=Xanthobacter cornucopiae TaxID=3119924 RepID=UPI003729D263
MIDAVFPSHIWRGLLAASALLAGAVPARAEGRLDAKYVLSVGGVELGRASVVVQAGADSYEISGSGRITGVMRAVSSGKGVAAARGMLTAGKMVPRVYALNAEADGKKEGARLAMAGGALAEMEVDPPLKPAPDRVPLTNATLQNIIDPMSGAFVYVPAPTELLSAAACERAVPVFDGRQRYDIVLTYLRTEQVKVSGYKGPAVVCGVRYQPVAGHRPSRYTVQYMVDNKDMFVWLVPIAGTRLMAPFKVSVATMIGTAVFQVTSFEAKADDKAKDEPVPVNAAKP